MRGRVLEEVAANCFSALRVLLNLLHRPVLSEPHPLRASINKSVSKSGIFGPPPNFKATSHKGHKYHKLITKPYMPHVEPYHRIRPIPSIPILSLASCPYSYSTP